MGVWIGRWWALWLPVIDSERATVRLRFYNVLQQRPGRALAY